MSRVFSGAVFGAPGRGFVLLVLSLCANARAALPELGTIEVGYRELTDEQLFDGVIEAVSRSTVSAQTSGEIVELPFDVNDFVPKGALILRIDDTRQKAELDKAEADADKAQARLEDARSKFERNKRLIKENAVSQSQLDKSEADLKSARAQVELAAAARDQAREQWEYTSVRAPFDGVVTERFVEIGEQVQVGSKLVAGLSLEKLRVKTEVPSRYAQRVREDSRARVALPDGSWVQSTELTFFPYADPASHTFSVRVKLPGEQHGVYPGMLVKVAFSIGRQPYLVVPSQAIVHRSEVTGVYVAGEDGRLQFRQLRLGRETPDGMTVVLAGLEAGEQVALDPVAAGIRLKQQRAGSADD